MQLTATLTIDMHGLEDMVRDHVANAGYVLEDIDIELDDPPQIKCQVRPMTLEEATAAGIDTRSKEDQLREILHEYTAIMHDRVSELESLILVTDRYKVVAEHYTHDDLGTPSMPEPLTAPRIAKEEAAAAAVPPTYLGAAAALSAEAAAKRKAGLRQQMKAESVIMSNPIVPYEEYPHD